MFSSEALRLYRAALRTAHSLPTSLLRTKTSYNIREAFEIYRHVQDASKRQNLVTEGWHDIGVLKEVLKADPAVLETLFKHFDTLNDFYRPTIAHADEFKPVMMDEPMIPHAEIEDSETNESKTMEPMIMSA